MAWRKQNCLKPFFMSEPTMLNSFTCLKTSALLLCLGIALGAQAKDDDKKGDGKSKPNPTQPPAATLGWAPMSQDNMLGLIKLAGTDLGDGRPLISCNLPVLVAQSAQDGTISFICEHPQNERLTGKLVSYRVHNLYLYQGKAAVRAGSCANVTSADTCRRMGL